MSLALVRVDDRLIHGQVAIMWSKMYPSDAIILLVDDFTAQDEFMKKVLTNAADAIKKKLHIFNAERAIVKLPEAVASEKRYFVLAKTIQQLYAVSKAGVDISNKVIFGTASLKPDSVKVANNIYLSKADAEACEFMANKGIDIEFKLIPDEKGASWSEIKKLF